jgi:GH3 auxin-responsive promoter
MNKLLLAVAFILLSLKMLWIKHFTYKTLVTSASHPEKTQFSVLQSILKKQQKTDFGIRHGFSSITSAKEYIHRIPIQEYDDLDPFIQKQIQTNSYSILSEEPKIYAKTSGTTNHSKYIPISKQTIDSYKRAQNIFSYKLHTEVPGIFAGKVLAIVSPAIEGYLNNGIPYGSMSGMVYQNMPKIVLAKYVLPPQIFNIENYETKYKLIAALAVYDFGISCIATANPSTLIKIIDTIQSDIDKIIEFVDSGNINTLQLDLTDKELEIFSNYHPNHKRAKQLHLLKETGNLLFSDLWPRLSAIVTWTCGNCALSLPKIRKQLLDHQKIIEMGYLSSEFRGTITIDCTNNQGVPTLEDNYFEFILVEEWDKGNRETLLLQELEQGKQYYIIVTTMNGLYRYFINDIIEVTGYFYNTPTIAFVQKGKGVTNITGEKLYESQLILAITSTIDYLGISTDFFIMLADEKTSSYQFYLETGSSFDTGQFTLELRNNLGKLNSEFKSKLLSKRIAFETIKLLKKGTYDSYKAHCVRSGQREGQFKVVKLQYKSNVNFPFEEFALT